MKMPKEWPTPEMIRAGMNAPTRGHPETGGSSIVDIFIAMYASAPTPPAQEVSCDGAESIADTDSVSEALGNFADDPTGDNAVAIVMAVMAEMQEPAQEAERVAVVENDFLAVSTVIRSNKDKPLGVSTKLYTRPQSDSLRKAAAELISWFDSPDELVGCYPGLNEKFENLRAALERKS